MHPDFFFILCYIKFSHIHPNTFTNGCIFANDSWAVSFWNVFKIQQMLICCQIPECTWIAVKMVGTVHRKRQVPIGDVKVSCRYIVLFYSPSVIRDSMPLIVVDMNSLPINALANTDITALLMLFLVTWLFAASAKWITHLSYTERSQARYRVLKWLHFHMHTSTANW